MTGYSNQPIPKEAAKQLLALDLGDKVLLSREKIEQWYDAWDGKCYVSFSGGKDSTVLAYLAAQELSRYRTPIYPLTLVFVNTGLEYPEIQHFVNDYAVWLQKRFPRIAD
nr:MAG TPA: phosphoadenosine-phosphosulfate reductase [Caudoviricetes sp.]